MQTRLEVRPNLKRRMILMIVAVLALIGVIAGVKVLLVMRMMSGMKPPPPPVVSTARAAYQEWQGEVRAVGTLRAARGADLALDVAGLVTRVNVRSGEEVREGQLLLQLRDSEDVAQLHQLEATAALAAVNFERAQREIAAQVIAKADYDQVAADLKAKQAAVAQQQVNVAKKQLRAPFAGRAGIVTINPGTYLDSGKTVVTLQQLDPVYVDFYVPQRMLAQLRPGQTITLILDAFKDRTFPGNVTAISPKVDLDTRNVEVEARAANPERVLTPGMFVNVTVAVGAEQRYLTLPQTAVVYNPYGETVFVVQHPQETGVAQPSAARTGVPASGTAVAAAAPGSATATPVVQQVFVTTGPTRGDQVAILSGLTEGTEVVSSGQIKLKNGASIQIDNKVQPASSPRPTPQEK